MVLSYWDFWNVWTMLLFGYREGNTYAINYTCNQTLTTDSTSTFKPKNGFQLQLARPKRASNDDEKKAEPKDCCPCLYKKAITVMFIIRLFSIAGCGVCIQVAITRA